MEIQTTARPKYTPLPTDDFLTFVITDQKEQESFFDAKKKVLNVEFSITTPGLDNRKVWRNYGPFWPRPSSTKVTQLFELVQAVDPTRAKIEADYIYDTKNLVGKTGRLMITDYLSKTRKEEPFMEDGTTPNPKAGQPLTMQKIKLVVGPKEGATQAAKATQATPDKDAVVAGAEPKQIKF